MVFHRIAAILLLISYAASCAGAGAPRGSSYLRGASAAQLGCAPSEVEISEHGQTLSNETWLASCRGRVYSCTRIATGYGTALSCRKSRPEPQQNTAREPRPAPANDTPSIAAPPVTAPPTAETPGTSEIRAVLDREREGILACGGWRLIGVQAQAQPNRALDVHLMGPLAGSPQEACVRQLLAQVRLASASANTLVVHVVR